MQNIKTSIIVRELGKCEKAEMEKIWTIIDSDISYTFVQRVDYPYIG